jgi:hypothetical protein
MPLALGLALQQQKVVQRRGIAWTALPPSDEDGLFRRIHFEQAHKICSIGFVDRFLVVMTMGCALVPLVRYFVLHTLFLSYICIQKMISWLQKYFTLNRSFD